MRIFGFNLGSEKKFVNVTCNIILSVMVVLVFALSIFSPVSVETVGGNGRGAIYYGNKNSNKVSLMVNVYWGNEFLEDMLNTFDEYNVKTTFFLGGSWCNKNVELVKKIFDSGHEIASHGYNHLDSTKISRQGLEKEIKMTENILLNILGIKPTLFAPPSGDVNANVVKTAEEFGYKTIMWTHDTIDWRDHNENLIFSRATQKTSGGDLILMHPTLHTSKALGRILQTLKDKGLEVTTVSEVIVG